MKDSEIKSTVVGDSGIGGTPSSECYSNKVRRRRKDAERALASFKQTIEKYQG